MNNPDPIQAAAMINAVTGERDHMSVSFPITGDFQVDFIAAVLAVRNALQLAPKNAAEVMEFLEKRFNRENDDMVKAGREYMEQKLAEMRRWESLQRLGGVGSGTPAPSNPPPWPMYAGTTSASIKGTAVPDPAKASFDKLLREAMGET